MHWPALLRYDFITLQRPSMVRILLEQALGRRYSELPVAFESHQLATVGHMVASGLGVSAVPALCHAQMQELGARCLPLRDPQIRRTVGVVISAGQELSVAARALHEVLQSTLAAEPVAPAPPEDGHAQPLGSPAAIH